MRLVTTAEMRALERRAFDSGVSQTDMMERAGRGVAHAVASWLDKTTGQHLLTLAGRGNNGGDAIIATRVLAAEYGVLPRILLLSDRAADPLLTWAWQTGVPVVLWEAATARDTLRQWLREADVVLDGILGTGARLPVEGAVAEVLTACREVSHSGQRRIAVDVPTGVQADTGAADAIAFRAALTVSTGPPKVGLFVHPGAEHSGRVRSVDLGVVATDDPLTLWRLEATDLGRLLPLRPDDSNKGTFGKVLVVAGSGRYVGAAVLAARAAVHCGAGLVTLAVPEAVQRMVAGMSLETTYLPLPGDPDAPQALAPADVAAVLDAAPGYDALAVGPGIGSHPATRRFVLDLAAGLAADGDAPPTVFDADALNALAGAVSWPRPEAMRWVLTPHPGEMGRLRQLAVSEVQADRLRTARESSRAWGQVVLLKGAPSIVAAADGRACLNVFANAALASAGTGDVLTGAVAGLLAQKLDPFDAAAAASYLHGLAGERWRAVNGPAGLAASRLLEHLPAAAEHVRRLA